MKCFKVWNCNKSKGKRISCSSFQEFLDSGNACLNAPLVCISKYIGSKQKYK